MGTVHGGLATALTMLAGMPDDTLHIDRHLVAIARLTGRRRTGQLRLGHRDPRRCIALDIVSGPDRDRRQEG
jgi:hypothetical protein